MKVRITTSNSTLWDVDVPDDDPTPIRTVWTAIQQHEIVEAALVRGDGGMRPAKEMLFNPRNVVNLAETP